jgi:hypothetical protein
MKIEDIIGPDNWDYFFNYALPSIPFEQNRKRAKDIALRTAIGNKALKKAIFEICTGKSIEGRPKYKEESIILSYLCVWNAFKKSNFNMYRFMKEKSYFLIEDENLRIEILMNVFSLLNLPIANYMVDWMNGYLDFFDRTPDLKLSDIDKDNSNDRIVTDTDVMVALFNCTREKEIWQLTSRGLGKIEDLFKCYMGIHDPFIEETTGIPCYIENNKEKGMEFLEYLLMDTTDSTETVRAEAVRLKKMVELIDKLNL